jgi:hypothetical protein
MDSLELTKLGACMLKHTNSTFLGVFARDQLPKPGEVTEHPACLISNTDTSNEPGEHWVAMYFPNDANIEFFDSYANSPDYYNFTIPTTTNLILSPFQIQSYESNKCGHFSLFYLYKRACNLSISNIFDCFTTSYLNNNDYIVEKFVSRMRKQCIHFAFDTYKTLCHCNQNCKCKHFI